jgi:hypothetical protein
MFPLSSVYMIGTTGAWSGEFSRLVLVVSLSPWFWFVWGLRWKTFGRSFGLRLLASCLTITSVGFGPPNRPFSVSVGSLALYLSVTLLFGSPAPPLHMFSQEPRRTKRADLETPRATSVPGLLSGGAIKVSVDQEPFPEGAKVGQRVLQSILSMWCMMCRGGGSLLYSACVCGVPSCCHSYLGDYRLGG